MRIVLYPTPALDVLAIARDLLPAGFVLEPVAAGPDPSTLARTLGGAEFLVGFVGHLPDEVWSEARALRLIQLLSAGYDSFPIERARALGVPVATNGGANAIAVAEHAVMLMLAVYRRLPELDRDVRAGRWRQATRGEVRYHELAGKRVGLLGMGAIGRQVAKRLLGFEVDLAYHDVRRLSSEDEVALRAAWLPLDDLLSRSDVLSLHLPLLPETRDILGARELSSMPQGSILVNTARGELVDETALARALRDGPLAAAGLDVLGQEPPSSDNPLVGLDNVLITPHAAGPTWESWPRRFANAYANVSRVARGEQPLWVIPELRNPASGRS